MTQKQLAAMTDFMTDGFLLDKLVDPELDDELLSTMILIFLKGLQATAAGWQAETAV